MKTFLHWVGGKKQLIGEISDRIPQSKRYIEPFLGGGAVLIYCLENNLFEEYYVNDLNTNLIEAYKKIKEDVEGLCKELSKLEKAYNSSSSKDTFYLEKREQYNLNPTPELFIFLNRTCFNGLFRTNKKGKFNTSFGKHKSVSFDLDNIRELSRKFQNVNFFNGDYSNMMEFVNEGSFVYMDPPYRPLNKGSFIAYNSEKFNDEKQIQLSEFCKGINNAKAKFLLSNSATEDGFFQQYYSEFMIEEVYAARSVNCDGNKRGKIKELLISN